MAVNGAKEKLALSARTISVDVGVPGEEPRSGDISRCWLFGGEECPNNRSLSDRRISHRARDILSRDAGDIALRF